MQAIRIANNRLPQVINATRPYTTTTNKMSLFPRFINNEFAPMFQLMDDYANHVQRRGGGSGNGTLSSGFPSSLRTFTPKFDVKENKDSYELHGELPGIEQKNINIEFTDAQTLTIKGRSEHSREEGERPSGFIEGVQEQGKLTEGEHKDNYHKPSVEEEGAQNNSKNTQVQKSQGEQKQHSRYWVSERSVGEFARTFSFPTRVDQDAVKASLKDGILSITVPKAQAPTSKRINIE
ncbi:heat shock protein [Fulvia fulva]|uniref:Heat shock protein n=1 Tax=Passalora fulva TaxID=5499 RepID=A0A9Q8UT85_PASFU|nr:heat shock protein [Fulvia fulva]UJO21552.1 heat shock protein [Fulvia fulva]